MPSLFHVGIVQLVAMHAPPYPLVIAADHHAQEYPPRRGLVRAILSDQLVQQLGCALPRLAAQRYVVC